MIKLGYALSSEEHSAQTLINLAQKAEETGFTYAFISDHFHPWVDQQGQSPFVWSTIGGISQKTKTLKLATGVTCPIIRTHPAIIAHAAATAATLLEGRFMLGLGTGENLNEHVVGVGWPPIWQRQEMLIEAIDIMRQLWEGGYQSYEGEYYSVDSARIYSLPEKLPPILIAASGKNSAAIAGKIGDGFISTSPNNNLIKTFEKEGGNGKPKYGQFTVCVAKTEKEAVQIAKKWWPNAAFAGMESQEFRIPEYFQQSASLVRDEDIAKSIVCSLDPQKHIETIEAYAKAGFDHIYVHQVGPDQKSFFEFYKKNILPKYS